MNKYIVLLIYVLLLVPIHAGLEFDSIHIYKDYEGNYAALLLRSAYDVMRVGFIMIWFSVLPAWFIATKVERPLVKYLIYLGGYAVFFAPLWLRPFAFDDPNKAFLRDVSMLLAVAMAVLVAIFASIRRKSRDSIT